MADNQIKNKQGLTEKEFLEQYDVSIYRKPSVTVDMLIFTIMDEEKENYRKLPEKSLKILLIKRGEHPYIGKWALPGGFACYDESLDEAAMRELKTETNIEDIYMEQLYTWGEVNRDPRTRVISSSYMALVDSTSLDIKAGDDADDAKWFNIKYNVLEENKVLQEKNFIYEKTVEIRLWNESEELSTKIKITESKDGKMSREIIENEGIAFDHGKFIEYALSRLRNKIEYTNLAFNLMPELFTLTELQQVYEIIQGKELLAPAF
ncbi:MAG: NUDIX domain-containing protein, partial [Bacillota bacterium]|nr:NUDIX domain-containing protein [Bacillota bacterium]